MEGTQSQQCSSLACQGITPVNQASQQNSERFIIHRPVFELGLGWQYNHCKFFALILPLRKYMVSFLSEENQNKITETFTRKKTTTIIPFFNTSGLASASHDGENSVPVRKILCENAR